MLAGSSGSYGPKTKTRGSVSTTARLQDRRNLEVSPYQEVEGAVVWTFLPPPQNNEASRDKDLRYTPWNVIFFQERRPTGSSDYGANECPSCLSSPNP